MVKYPKFASIGGNTGKVNSFVGINAMNLTGGIFNAENLLQDNNLTCMTLQFAVKGKSISLVACSPMLPLLSTC
jgi:hypothetical protein